MLIIEKIFFWYLSNVKSKGSAYVLPGEGIEKNLEMFLPKKLTIST